MFDRLTPVNRALIVANVGIFIVQLLVGTSLIAQFALWPPTAAGMGGMPFRIWQLLTYGFLHINALDLFFHLFAQFIFGSTVENALGSKRFAAYYLIGIVGGGLMHLIVVQFAHLVPAPLIGASAAIMALLLAFAMLFPNRELIIFPIPIPIRAWVVVVLYAIFEFGMSLYQARSGVAQFSALGGMATGFVMIRYWSAQARRPRD